MTTFDQRLNALDTQDLREVKALANEYAEGVKDAAGYLAQAAQLGGKTGAVALAGCEVLREAACAALMQQIESAPALSLAQISRNMIAAQSAVTDRLRLALADTRVIQPEQSRHTAEEPEPSFRIQDEAYLCLRRILRPESELRFQLETDEFLARGESIRTELIREFSRSGHFRDLASDNEY